MEIAPDATQLAQGTHQPASWKVVTVAPLFDGSFSRTEPVYCTREWVKDWLGFIRNRDDVRVTWA